jgi:nucleoside-diphosphate-sugar epimerase
MERVLVTGAGGYIGTTLVPMLVSRGYRVRALDRFFFGGDLLTKDDGIEIVKEDNRKVDATHLEGVDYIIDLAALSNDPSGELFQNATWAINHLSRARIARLAKESGAKRYILPSSCSIYGFQEEGVIANEDSPAQPLTTYAKANLEAENDILPLADEKFSVTVLRQATVYGYSPRMRFDLAINGMTYGASKTGKLPLLRDGTQWRPMVHVKDTARAMCFMLQADREQVNGQIFNVGSEKNNYQLAKLAETVAATLPGDIQIEWYGDPDHRSYRVAFDKIESIGYQAQFVAEDGVNEIREALESGELDKTVKTITLDWYKELVKWHKIIKEVEMYGGIVDI